MAAAMKYVTKRGGVYQYVRRVPAKVLRHPAHHAVHFGSQDLYRVSLKTKDEIQMHLACVAAHLDFERKVASVSGAAVATKGPAATLVAKPRRPVTDADLENLADRYRQLTVAPYEHGKVMANVSDADTEEYKRMVYELELYAEETNEVLLNHGKASGETDTPADIAAWVVKNDGWDAPAGSKAFGAVAGAIRAGIIQGRQQIQAVLEGTAVPRLAPSQPAVKDDTQTLAEAAKAYITEKKLRTRTETEVKATLRDFEKLIGNKTLGALTRRDFQNYAEHIGKKTIGGKSAGSIMRPASKGTVTKAVGLLRTVIGHAIDRGRFDGINPAKDINIDAYVVKRDRAVMPEKRRFTVDELNLIFQHPWFTGCASSTDTHAPGNYRLKGAEFWLPMVALFTGCRASELGGLMLSEIELGGTCPHFVIRDNDNRQTKTGARKVPILNELLNLGFASYVEKVRKVGAGRLFPDWLPSSNAKATSNDDYRWSNSKVIRAFNRTVVPEMLKGRLLPGARTEVTFHGFRGAFKAMIGRAEYHLSQNFINEVVGHTKSGMDARYIGEIAIEETYPAVKDCRYPGLVLPSPPPL